MRAAVFGTLALLLAVAAHAAAGGPLPDPLTVVALGMPVACASVVLARRRRGLVGITVCLALAQVLLHEGLMLASTMSSCAPAAAGGGGHAAMPGMQVASCTTTSMGAMVPGAVMITAHLLATLVTALLLAHGERLASRLGAWVGLRPPLAVARPAARVPGAIPSAVPQVVTQLVATGSLSRRGPPRVPFPVPSFA